ncbi:myc box-dependent-interacting protein 1-like isoform X2 [Orbicella faveolata]|uniref:myc box-dependent-interacting protein 1-like isoform X2 n=1 Tax=Orbicella faveolata TaxID=48498 RepID=UPI0009E26CA2|nr:myc box-dependent-interacting protein 1-like isoform X2 [Orbicella faveolata]
MAEKTDKGFMARTASITAKRAKRAQEKVMQKLGKANETKDLTFDEFVTNFNKQQSAAQRLHKELKNYYSCVKAMLVSSDAFGDAVREVYEPEWPGRDKLIQYLEELHNQWQELVEKLDDEVIIPLTAYQSQFPDIKARINKRGRKLVDYDRYRHNLETLKAKGKTADPKKLAQAEEEYNEAKSVYTKLHAELYEELPALFDSRIGYYVSSFQSIFTAEGVFHREAAKTKTQVNDLMDGLIQDMSTGTYTTKRPYPVASENQVSDSDDMDTQTTSSHAESGDAVVCNDEAAATESAEDGTAEKVVDGGDALNPFTHSDHDEQDGVGGETAIQQETQEKPKPIPVTQPPPPQVDSSGKKAGEKPQVQPLPVTQPVQPQTDSSEGSPSNEEAAPLTASQTEGAQQQPSQQLSQQPSQQQQQEVSTSEIPGVLYKVRAAYKYVAEDDDELSFEKGEIISVIEFEDPEEQDEGWLLGILELSGIKGVFPANFTKRI